MNETFERQPFRLDEAAGVTARGFELPQGRTGHIRLDCCREEQFAGSEPNHRLELPQQRRVVSAPISSVSLPTARHGVATQRAWKTAGMPSVAMLCTDGSELARHALAAGLRVIAPADRTVVVTVMEPVDVSLLTGVSGFGGAVMSQEQFEDDVAAQRHIADQIVRETVSALDLENADTIVLEGDPGRALCDLADELGATVIVVGSRGRGGLKRAVLGSVSDHLVRNAPCPILVTGPD